MNTPSNNVIKCACCGKDVEEEAAHVDPDLELPVCAPCKTDLRWAQAWLKKAEIIGCVKR